MRARLLIGANVIVTFVVAWAGIAASVAAGAQAGGLEAGLYVRRDALVIENAATSLNARVDHLGIRYSEQVNRQLTLGLLGGIVAVDTSGQSLTEGMHLTGNYLGADLNGTILGADWWRLGYGLSVIYHSMEDEIDGQRVALDWLESGAGLAVSVDVSGTVSVYGGPHYRNLDIDQRSRGAINSTAGFSEQEAIDSVLGAVLEVDPGGFVDLGLHRGASDGFMLTFSRKY